MTDEARSIAHRGHVMGTRLHVVLVGGAAGAIERAVERLEDLEARWSRFRPDSEISRLNRSPGRPVVVSAPTFALLSRAVAESQATGGAFDPTVLPALDAAGYDRDFPSVAPDSPDPAGVAIPAPGVALVELDPTVRAVVLPPDTTIDAGGIGKGFAADLVVDELRAAGVAGACVNIGGDLRVSGEPPDGQAWCIAVEREPGTSDPADDSRCLLLAEGGVATTSVRRRTWVRAGRRCHHVIDPRTGAPAARPWSSVTVVAGDAAGAEVTATAAFLADDVAAADSLVRARAAAGFTVDTTGRRQPLGDVHGFLRDCPVAPSPELVLDANWHAPGTDVMGRFLRSAGHRHD